MDPENSKKKKQSRSVDAVLRLLGVLYDVLHGD